MEGLLSTGPAPSSFYEGGRNIYIYIYIYIYFLLFIVYFNVTRITTEYRSWHVNKFIKRTFLPIRGKSLGLRPEQELGDGH